MDANFWDRKGHEEARKEVQEWLEKDEIMWCQRSMALWLKEGDRDTMYFHQKASSRHQKNEIHKLRAEDGSWKEGIPLATYITEYFQALFTTIGHDHSMEFLDSLKGKVSGSMNESLYLEFTREEVFATLQKMQPTKAPGPNGILLGISHEGNSTGSQFSLVHYWLQPYLHYFDS